MSQTEARDILSTEFRIDHRDCHLEPVTRSGFSGAVIFRISQGGQDMALRRWPRRTIALDRIAALHRWLTFLGHTCELPVPQPMERPNGDTFVRVRGHVWHLETWMPGTPDWGDSAEELQQKLADAFRVIAGLHRGSATYECPAGDREWFAPAADRTAPVVKERATMLRTSTPASVMQLGQRVGNAWPLIAPRHTRWFADWWSGFAENYCALHRIAVEQMNRLRDLRVPLVPVWRDLWSDHVLFDETGVTGLIDAVAARRETVATDLARLLGSFPDLSLSKCHEAIDVYHRIRPLHLSEWRLILALQLSSALLAPVQWLQRFDASNGCMTLQPLQWEMLLVRLACFRARLEVFQAAGESAWL